MVALLAIVVGLTLGAFLGGTLDALGRLHLKLQWVILPLFILQGVARGRLLGLEETSAAQPFWISISVVLLMSAVINWRFPGMLVVASGVALNVLPVLLNSGMPVVLESTPGVSIQPGGFYHLAEIGDVAHFMGDCMTLSSPFGRFLLSSGDVVLAVGVVVVIIAAMRGAEPDIANHPS